MAGVLPFWRHLAGNALATGIIVGVNAAVVGLLAAALYNPIITSAITGIFDGFIVVIGFFILTKWRVSPLIIVLFCIIMKLLALGLLAI